MLCCGLTATLVIMINGMISAPVKAVGHRAPESSQLHFRNENNSVSERCPMVRRLDSVVNIILKNAMGKYDLKQEELKALYTGVTHCGLNNCGEFPDLLPQIQTFKCRNQEQNLKNQTKGLLLNFYKGVHDFKRFFKQLIAFEKLKFFETQGISNGSRLGVLQGFETDIKRLGKKIIPKKQRLEFLSKAKTAKMKRPISQTDLMIYEWRTIQQSKDFLTKWRKPLENMCNCWKRRKFCRGELKVKTRCCFRWNQ